MILVVGATGILGGLITQRLLEEGRDVRILVRQASSSEEMALKKMATSPRSLIDAGAIPVYGDLKDPASLEIACDGIETLITTANSAMRGGDDNVETVDHQGSLSLIEAARTAGVKQFIFTSFLNASLNDPMPLYRAKAEAEKALAESGLVYTVLAPNYYMERIISLVVGIPLRAHQPITLVGQGKRLHFLISIRDVAAFAVAAVGHPGAINRRLILGGPEPLTWRGIVEAFGRHLGQELPMRFVAPGDEIPGLPEKAHAILTSMETYDSPIPMGETARIFGVQLTTLASFVDRMLGTPVAS